MRRFLSFLSFLSILTLLGLAATGPLFAQGFWPLLEDSPISRFSDEDLALFQAAQSEALEERPDGSAVSWENPDTGASGSLIPLKTDRIGERRCRLLRIINHAGGFSGDSRFWFCKQPDGSWKITSPEKQQKQRK